jgi:hypothetical protein
MSARIARALTAAIAIALLLSACTGIPTSGPVIAGPAVDEVDPELVVTPSGPPAGANPTQILNGFMSAVRAPQGDYQVARQFLTPGLASSWEPDAGVVIRGTAPTLTETGTGSTPVIVYAFDTSASVDAAGRYRAAAEAGSRSLEFTFQQVDGQWRISSAPDGTVLGPVSFGTVFSEYALYYFDPSGRYLVPDLRWFPAGRSTPSLAVASLLAGPDDWLQHSVVTDFPAGTALGSRGVVVTGSRAAVDLTSVVASATPEELDRMHQQLVATLGIPDVTILADGVALRVGAVGPQAVVDPQPTGATLAGTTTEFGHVGATGIVPIPGLSTSVIAVGPRSAVVDAGQTAAAVLAADGTVRVVTAGGSTPVDAREGLIAPSLDDYGWTWSAAGSGLEAFASDGTAAGLPASAIPADATIVSLAVSRDSTRLALALDGPTGPRLLVFGIVRVAGAPTGLDPPLELPAPGPIASVEWVDDRSLIVVADALESRLAVVVPLGAPAESLGALPEGAIAVGGRGGVLGIRALADGVVWAPGGNNGWTEAGLSATYLGVQQ